MTQFHLVECVSARKKKAMESSWFLTLPTWFWHRLLQHLEFSILPSPWVNSQCQAQRERQSSWVKTLLLNKLVNIRLCIIKNVNFMEKKKTDCIFCFHWNGCEEVGTWWCWWSHRCQWVDPLGRSRSWWKKATLLELWDNGSGEWRWWRWRWWIWKKGTTGSCDCEDNDGKRSNQEEPPQPCLPFFSVCLWMWMKRKKKKNVAPNG